ncbi:PREDICTED: ferritin light chain-like, partial [Myotis brandtii]|uniref:ferritin light chain-like n=1 Tax=Myotis brandtii TaxID=109478 RepID=UPI000703E1C6
RSGVGPRDRHWLPASSRPAPSCPSWAVAPVDCGYGFQEAPYLLLTTWPDPSTNQLPAGARALSGVRDRRGAGLLQVLGRNRLRDAPSSSLRPAPTSFPVTTFRTTSAILSLRDQPTRRFYLNSYCRTTMSSQTRQNYSTEGEAAVNRLACVCRAPTYLSLRYYFDHEDVALQGAGHFLRELVEKSARALSGSSSCKTSAVATFSPGHAEPPQDEWVKLRAKDRLGLGEEPEPGLWWELPLVLLTDPQLCDFRENHFLGEEVKLIKKMGDTWLPSAVWPALRLVWVRLTLQQDQEPLEPRGL